MDALWPFAAINAPALGLLAGFVVLPHADSSARRRHYAVYAAAALVLAAIAFAVTAPFPAFALEIAGVALLAPFIPKPVDPPSDRSPERGTVFVVGGGPGDPGLLTLRAAAVIAQAQVLLYDALVSDPIVAMAPAACERIFVGKRRGVYAMPQEDILGLMIRHSVAGKRVVRLKGGDPFVYGRGGEEALGLHDAGVPFEIVPGISSALAVAAYAGIPLTHRGVSASFTVATGHEDPSKPHAQIDWQSLANPNGTVVFLMGLAELPNICRRLIEHGHASAAAVAVIENGTLPNQRTIVGTLATIARKVRQQHVTGPSVVVVGDVVRLRERIAWFEARPVGAGRVA
jgi:uroporphyrinogen III methyltransferase/synthase